MATFEAQVEAITGIAIESAESTPTQDELTEFLKDGVLDVTQKWLSAYPEDMELFGRETSTSDAQGVSVGGAKIIHVIREAGADGSTDGSTAWEPCSQIPTSMQSKVVDKDSLFYASAFNPVYTVNSDKTINVYPVPSANNGFKVFYVNEEPRDISNNTNLIYSHSNIKYFPNDKVRLVVIYASMKSIQAKMSSIEMGVYKSSLAIALDDIPEFEDYVGPNAIETANAYTVDLSTISEHIPEFVNPSGASGTDISGVAWSTAYPANQNEIDSFTDIASGSEGKIIVALNKISSLIDQSGSFDAINVSTSLLDATTKQSTLLDEVVDETIDPTASSVLSGRFQEIKDAIDRAKALLSSSSTPANVNTHLDNEDPEMVMQTLAAVEAELKVAGNVNAELSLGLNSTTALGALVGSYSNAIDSYVKEANGYISVVNTNLAIRQGKISEFTAMVNANLQDFNQQNSIYQAHVQKLVANAQTELNRAIKNADMAQAAEIQTLTVKLQEHGALVNLYSTELSGQIQEYNAELTEKTNNYNWLAGIFTQLAQEYAAAFIPVGKSLEIQKQQAMRGNRRG